MQKDFCKALKPSQLRSLHLFTQTAHGGRYLQTIVLHGFHEHFWLSLLLLSIAFPFPTHS